MFANWQFPMFDLIGILPSLKIFHHKLMAIFPYISTDIIRVLKSSNYRFSWKIVGFFSTSLRVAKFAVECYQIIIFLESVSSTLILRFGELSENSQNCKKVRNEMNRRVFFGNKTLLSFQKSSL